MDSITKNALDQISGAISAHTCVLENLCALLLVREKDAPTAARNMGAEMTRQFSLPPIGDYTPGMQVFAIQQAGIEYLERFWVNVEDRLKSAS